MRPTRWLIAAIAGALLAGAVSCLQSGVCHNGACEPDAGEDCLSCPEDCGEEVDVDVCPGENLCPGGQVRVECLDAHTLLCCGPV